MDLAIAEELREQGKDARAARDEKMLTIGDPEQLQFAVATGRVLCTEDSDFTDPSFFTSEHYGIAYYRNSHLGIGYAVRALLTFYGSESVESMKNSPRYM